MTHESARDDRSRWAYDTFHALANLDPVTASALLLLYCGRLTQPEVAARLGLSESEVKGRIADGMRHLGRLVVGSNADRPDTTRARAIPTNIHDLEVTFPAEPLAETAAS
jgi:Sigma-70, region 4